MPAETQLVDHHLTVRVCRVHFLRNVLAAVPKASGEMVAAAIRTIFAQPKAEMVHDQLDVIAGMLDQQLGPAVPTQPAQHPHPLTLQRIPTSTDRHRGRHRDHRDATPASPAASW
jgi:hypothetical protein